MNTKISTKQLSEIAIPIFDYSVKTIEHSAKTLDAPWQAFSQSIQLDPGIVLKILRTMGASKNSLRAEDPSLEQATMVMGVEQTVQCVKSLPRIKLMPKQARQGLLQVISRSHHAAYQAWYWARALGDLAPEQVYLATLLYDVPEMLLWKSDCENMLKLSAQLQEQILPRDEAQYIVLGNSVEHFARELALEWNLPQFLQDCLRPENIEQPRIRSVVLAVQMARLAENGWYSDELALLLEQVAEHLNKPLAQAVTEIHKLAVNAAHQTPFYNTLPAAALLPMLSIQKRKTNNPVATNKISRQASALESSHSTASSKVPKREESSANTVCLTPQKNLYENTIKELEQNAHLLNLHNIIRTVIHGMHDGIGLNRVVFAMINKDRTHLVARYMVGTDNDPLFNRFKLGLKSPHLFTRMLEKPQSIWINDDNRKSFWPLVPNAVKNLIKTDSFLARSIHINGKAIGLFYADRCSPSCSLDDLSYNRFRNVCQIAEQQLSQKSSI